MRVLPRSEARRMLKRVFKTGSVEPRLKVSPLAQKTDDELLTMLSKTKDRRKAERIGREIARRLALQRYHSSSTPNDADF
jgi:hypothetical protein